MDGKRKGEAAASERHDRVAGFSLAIHTQTKKKGRREAGWGEPRGHVSQPVAHGKGC